MPRRNGPSPSGIEFMDLKPSPLVSNIACFGAMLFWAIGFPATEVLLDSWGALTMPTVDWPRGLKLLKYFVLALVALAKRIMARIQKIAPSPNWL